MERIRVFLVDDYPLAREGIRQLLEIDDRILVVGEAESAEDALDMVRATSPQVVLMDINLPGVDGIEATRRLMAQDSNLKVVMLTSLWG